MPIAVASSSAHAGEFDLGGKFRAPSEDHAGRRPSRVVVGTGMDIYSFFDEQNKELTDRDRYTAYQSRKLMYLVVAQFFISPAIVISQGVVAVTTVTFIMETAVALGGALMVLLSGLVAYLSYNRPGKCTIILSVVFGLGAWFYSVGIITLAIRLIGRNHTQDLTFNCILIFLSALEMVLTMVQIHAGMSLVSNCDLSF